MDPGGDGGGGLTATGLFCGSCGAQSSPTAKFCAECGTRLTQASQSAEYKQVTVLFAESGWSSKGYKHGGYSLSCDQQTGQVIAIEGFAGAHSSSGAGGTRG